MTLNILFLSVTIKKRIMSAKELLQNEMIRKIEEENRERQAKFSHLF
jgi:uncharacterized protein (TIGR02413 family)